jgi:hypothetical protein
MDRAALASSVCSSVGGLAGFSGDVTQAATGIRQSLRRIAQFGHHAQLVQRVVQLARDLAQALKNLGRGGGACDR